MDKKTDLQSLSREELILKLEDAGRTEKENAEMIARYKKAFRALNNFRYIVGAAESIMQEKEFPDYTEFFRCVKAADNALGVILDPNL